jgi:uncharacterized protein (AIM24 family)
MKTVELENRGLLSPGASADDHKDKEEQLPSYLDSISSWGYMDPLIAGQSIRDEKIAQSEIQFFDLENIPDVSNVAVKHTVRGRPAFAVVTTFLDDGDQITSDGGSMMWMDGKVKVRTHIHGGTGDGCGRCCSGETCCFNTYSGPGRVTFGFELPGNILAFAVSPGNGWIIAQNSYIASSNNLHISGKFPGCFACCCGGQTLMGVNMTHIYTESTPGIFWAGTYGEIIVSLLLMLFVDRLCSETRGSIRR